MKKNKTIIFVSLLCAIIVPTVCVLLVLHIHNESNKKYNEELKNELVNTVKAVELSQQSLKDLCEYELSNCIIEDEMTIIQNTGQFQNTRDLIFHDLGFSEAYIPQHIPESLVVFRKSWDHYRGISIIYYADGNKNIVPDEESFVVGENFYICIYRT